MLTIEAVERYAASLKERGVCITETYADWLAVCFACASFGEAGRASAHLLSSTSTKYKVEDTDRQFNACLRSVKDSQNASVILALGKAAGVLLTDVLRPSAPSTAPQVVASSPSPAPFPSLSPFPLLSELSAVASSFSLLPSVVWAFLAGFSAVASSLSIRYGGQEQRCHLYYCLAAPAASGKSCISIVAKSFGKWHKVLRERSAAEWDEYEATIKAMKAEDRALIKEPRQRSLFLPADTTTAALLASVRDNDGGGLMWESELDTIVRANKSEFGSYSDILRNNYHSEPIRSNRKQGRQFLELENTHFACVACGTPQQVGRFFQSAENGLFSRFAFSVLPPSLEWRSQFDVPSFSPLVASIADAVAEWGRLFQTCSVSVGFSPSQVAEHTQRWRSSQELWYGIAGDAILPSVRRLALMQCKLAALLTLLEGGLPQSSWVQCSPAAWQVARHLAETAVTDAVAALSLLPSAEQEGGKKAAERERVLLSLPQEFTAAQLPPTLSTATKYRWLAVWEREGKITKTKEGWTRH